MHQNGRWRLLSAWPAHRTCSAAPRGESLESGDELADQQAGERCRRRDADGLRSVYRKLGVSRRVLLAQALADAGLAA
jgi:hypothetical protein